MTEENPNVLRCREYRDRNRIMMKKGEKQLDYLTRAGSILTSQSARSIWIIPLLLCSNFI